MRRSGWGLRLGPANPFLGDAVAAARTTTVSIAKVQGTVPHTEMGGPCTASQGIQVKDCQKHRRNVPAGLPSTQPVFGFCVLAVTHLGWGLLVPCV